MTSRRVTPLLLAASILLTGATGTLMGSMTSAHAITSVDELTDVNQSSWAYDALRDLVEKYDVIQGYPDHTFRGGHTPTRWELAAALNAVMKSVGSNLARLGADKADKADLETLAKLQDEFKNELAALQARTDALESRASAIEAKNSEQDQRLTLLERTQIHGDAVVGVLSDFGTRGARNQFNAPGSGNRSPLDGTAALARLRLSMDDPVLEDRTDSKVGQGEVHARIIAGYGGIAPAGIGQGSGPAGPFSSFSSIAGDASSLDQGVNPNNAALGVSTGTSNRSSLYVEDMHYHQHFKSGIPLLTDWMLGSASNDKAWATTGDLYVGSMPWRNLFDKSPYRGNDLTQFQDSAFMNTPGIAVNQNMPMLAYQWHQGLGSDKLSLDVTAAASSVNVLDTMDGLNASYEARLNYQLLGLAGGLYGGGYNIWGAGSTISGSNTLTALVNRSGLNGHLGQNKLDTNAFYAGWNQEWYKGIGTTFNYFWTSNGWENYLLTTFNQGLAAGTATVLSAPGTFTGVASAPKQSISGVLNIPMKVFGIRKHDNIGIGLSVLKLEPNNLNASVASNTRYKQAWEKTAEAYYKWSINDAIAIIPSVEVIDNAMGIRANGITTVVGLRTSISF